MRLRSHFDVKEKGRKLKVEDVNIEKLANRDYSARKKVFDKGASRSGFY